MDENHKLSWTQPAQAPSPWANPLSNKSLETSPRGSLPHHDAVRIAALAVYAETGNATQAARTLGLPQQTVDQWVKADGAPQLIDELRSTIRYECGWELASMVKEQLALTRRAMADGVPHVLKDGSVVYTRQSPKDAAITASILLDKWMLVSGALSATNSLLQSVDSLSKQLAAAGAELAKGRGDAAPGPTRDSGGPLADPGVGESYIE